MKIYSMTATFGKLANATLTLEPGLNIIHAPNEWGKSTWCAFLVNMLYGIDTRARSTATAIADKERYAPWSGAPMAGRIDLNWNGRDITIERSTKGRVVFGNFRAYETATGIDVPELNGTNCGQMLLGVERSVFTRAGFLRQNDLPVTQDDSLRRRLNNLVTTGDESGDGDRLGDTLKELKNKCRYNRSGLLPNAETERDQLQQQLSNLHDLQNRSLELQAAQAQLEEQIAALRNHANALRYQASQDHRQKLAQAEEAWTQAQQRVRELEEQCNGLTTSEEARQHLQKAQALQEALFNLHDQTQLLPPTPAEPRFPAADVSAAMADEESYAALEASKKKNNLIVGIYGILDVIALALGLWQSQWLPWCGLAVILAGVAVATVCTLRSSRIRKAQRAIAERYPGFLPQEWAAQANAINEEWEAYHQAQAKARAERAQFEQSQQQLQSKLDALTGNRPLAECIAHWNEIINLWDQLDRARSDLKYSRERHQILHSTMTQVAAPEQPDLLHYSAEETARLLEDAQQRQKQLHIELGQRQGQAENLGSETLIKARLDTLNGRIQRLEDTYYALEMAQDALRSATQQLQRRFAPRISQRAQALFHRLTGGRYQRVTMGEDFSLNAAAEEEITLRPAQWRSDGTVDQLYLALRLAVAEELTPDAPLVLDDALVRFDDDRLKTAMEILRDTAQNKQVILFTCQTRETNV